MKLGQECPKTQGERHWTARAKERLRPARGEQHYAAWLSAVRVRALRALHRKGMSVALLAANSTRRIQRFATL